MSRCELRLEGFHQELGAKAIHAIAVAPETFHAKAHAFAQLATDETAHAVGLPLGGPREADAAGRAIRRLGVAEDAMLV
jgi:hypothetical protein